MSSLSITEILFYGGIAVMATAVVLALVSVVVFRVTGARIRGKLEQEYGKPHK